jgi:autotransporter-associated beta strand protein
MKKTNNMLALCAWIALLLVITANPVSAATWDGDGSDNNWSTTNNWSGDVVPVAGDPLVFAGTARLVNVNDTTADTSYSGITFNSGAGLFELGGNRITLGGNIVNNDDSTHRVNFDMALGATRDITLNSGHVYLTGDLSGAGGITALGATSKILVLNGDNTYTGKTTVAGCVLRIASDTALGTTDGVTVVDANRRMELLGGVVITGETAFITGAGGNYNGAIQSISGSNVWDGAIILGGSNTRLGTTSSSASLTVSGTIDDGPVTYNLNIRNQSIGGPVIISGTNTYDGETRIIVGNMRLAGGDNRLPLQSVVRLGNGSDVDWAEWDLGGQNQEIKGLIDDGTTMRREVINSSTEFSTLTVNNSSAYTYDGIMSDRINLIKKGSGTFTLATGDNLFRGETVIQEGTLALASSMSIGGSTFNTSESAGTLSFTDNTAINFGGLIGTNDIVMTNALGQSVSLHIRGVQTDVFNGQILDGADFTKAGEGTFTMMQTNTFTGKAYIIGGTLYLPFEDSLGLYPSTFVQDQITFDGGWLRADTNYLFAANNRGVTLDSGGAKFFMGSYTGIRTVAKQLVGTGGVTATGYGVVLMSASNSYDGVTTVENKVLRITDNMSLGSTAGGMVVKEGAQLELEDGVVVSGETLSLSGAGITSESNIPPTSSSSNRGALEAAKDATAEWAGPILLVSSVPRVGAQNNGHLIISGNISDATVPIQFRTSTNPWDKNRGVELRGNNSYLGSTDITRGTLFMGATNTISSASVLNVHFAEVNNGEYAGLDMKGFDQRIAGLMNTGNTGANAAIVNSASRPAVLTIDQNIDTTYRGTVKDDVALVKEGTGNLSLAFPTTHTGSTTVSEGTLTLGTNGVLAANSFVILDGGTLNNSSYTNSMGTLNVRAASTIDLGTGEISFTTQSSDGWSGQLDLIGTLGSTSLRFDPKLTTSQLSLVTYDGKSVMQSADGYIREIHGTIIIVR